MKGIKGVDLIQFFVREQQRYEQLLNWMGFRVQGNTFASGPCHVNCIEPKDGDEVGARFLNHHPDGVGQIMFAVDDVWAYAHELAGRGATLITDVEHSDEGAWFDITTPIGDVIFRFRQPPLDQAIVSGPYLGLDHFTCHFLTMGPVIQWFEEVMGFERYWSYHFHTRSECQGMTGKPGTGMRSQVMRCPQSGVTFALNEPMRPDFLRSQVYRFVMDNRGPGVQHIALQVPSVCTAVGDLHSSNFLFTPNCYYDDLSRRLARAGVACINESIEQLARLGILVDAEGPEQYLLQIFMRPLSALLQDERCGPFFFELIQRQGAQGFGEGNFRALFEAIERSEST